MGYPMNYGRVVGRNQLAGDYAGTFNAEDRREQSLSLIRGDMRRLESDQRDERHLAAYAKRAGITPAQVKQVLDDFFGEHDVWSLPAEAQLSETREWIACSERLPQQGKMVLVFGGRDHNTKGGQEVLLYHTGQSENGWPIGYQSYNAPTHWMPLPESPK